MERRGQAAQVEGHVVRGEFGGCAGEHVGVGGQGQHQRGLGGRGQQRQVGPGQRGHVAAAGAPLRQHRADARMRVLHIEHRVLVVLLEREVDVEHELGVGLAAEHEKAHRVAAGPVDQVAQRDVAAGSLGDLHLLAAAHHRHHLVQHVVGVAGRRVLPGGLHAGAHAGDGAVVVAALDVDGAGEAALQLGQVVGHVGHEVGVATVGLAHHAVLVVAVLGGAQPQRAAFFEGLAGAHKAAHGVVDAAAGVQAGLEEVVVEAHAQGLQVQVLLVAQVGHGELADAVHVVRVARGGEGAVVGIHRLLRREVGRHVGDVAAVVGALGPLRVARLQGLADAPGRRP